MLTLNGAMDHLTKQNDGRPTRPLDLSFPIPSPVDLTVFGERLAFLPGLADVHVHLREPGFSYKETVLDGTRAAARGGFTTVCAMPNLDPVPDSREHLAKELVLIERDAVIEVLPYGALTVGEQGVALSDMEGIAPRVVAFSDDGRGVQDPAVMREAMMRAKRLGKIVVAHCEDNSLLRGGYVHDGAYCRAHGHKGIVSESEWGAVKRDLELVRETGCAYHVCHVSAKETVELIRRAKAEGLDVTCETAPHYLLLDDSMLEEDGRFKMNPPIRDKSDRDALIAGIKDGTIDMIVTDHAPHTEEEKSRGLAGSPMGIVGLETSFPLLYTYLVLPGILSLDRLIELMSDNPRKRFGLAEREDDYTVFDLGARYKIDPADFLSKGRSTPFAGWEVAGKCMLTVSRGKIAYLDPTLKARTK
ncbi:MAG: dihydroorotase [Clostridia bacterium]|nr:dihydroorotase [Clostridia bacterium]